MESTSQFASIRLVTQSIRETRKALYTSREHYKKERKANKGTRCYVPAHITDQEKRLKILEDIKQKLLIPNKERQNIRNENIDARSRDYGTNT